MMLHLSIASAMTTTGRENYKTCDKKVKYFKTISSRAQQLSEKRAAANTLLKTKTYLFPFSNLLGEILDILGLPISGENVRTFHVLIDNGFEKTNDFVNVFILFLLEGQKHRFYLSKQTGFSPFSV